ENERTEEEYEEQERLKCSDTEILQLPSKLQHFNKKKSTKKVKRQTKAIANIRKKVVQLEQKETYNKDEKNKSDIIITTSSILESEIPKEGSFVWHYFHHSENLITSTCAVIMHDGKECNVSYNDSSTTSNLISHLARIHKNYEDNEPFLSLILRSTSKTYSDTETIEGSEDNDEVYEKKKLILDDIYIKLNELSKNENELNNYLSLEEKGKDTDPFDW
ncbi:4743_t:CDS:2, partial [Funneliformis caledonium]